MGLAVVLVEPAGPLNVGSVARLCANFGIDDLRLVAPRCRISDEEALRMAVHGQTVLRKAKTFETLLEAIGDCKRVVASCGRIDHGHIPLQTSDQAMPWVEEGLRSGAQVALVFGREDRGLSNEELLLSQRVVRLQTDDQYPSLNLSHAVAIVLHDLQRCKLLVRSDHPCPQLEPEAAAQPQLDDCMQDAQELLLEAGFLLPHTARARMAKIRSLLQRASIRPQELAMLRGMVRQLRWAIRCHRP
ncbi:RNA methyltransferase [Synechococcus sp. A10-1-5-9]|uniref:RNA methyltransferase n=1 Tax=Synechococcus sp. A10-1-5-9 TaxID=3392295 RepID=UPI0039EAFBF0